MDFKGPDVRVNLKAAMQVTNLENQRRNAASRRFFYKSRSICSNLRDAFPNCKTHRSKNAGDSPVTARHEIELAGIPP